MDRCKGSSRPIHRDSVFFVTPNVYCNYIFRPTTNHRDLGGKPWNVLVVDSAVVTVSGSFQQGWSQREREKKQRIYRYPGQCTGKQFSYKPVLPMVNVSSKFPKGCLLGCHPTTLPKMREPQTPKFPVREIYIIHPIRCRKKSIISMVRFFLKYEAEISTENLVPLNGQVQLFNRCEAGACFLRSTTPHPKGTDGFNFRVYALFMLTMFDARESNSTWQHICIRCLF